MYASQNKRLCVRGAPSDDTARVQHHSTSSDVTTTGLVQHQPQPQPRSRNNQPQLPPREREAAEEELLRSESSYSFPGNQLKPGSASATTAMTAPASVRSQASGGGGVGGGGGDDGDEEVPITSAPANDSNNHQRTTTNGQDSETHTEQDLINRLANETLEETKLELLLSIRNLITACNKKKDLVVSNPNFNKIIQLMDDDKPSSTVKTQIALLLCSLAKSGEHNVKVLNECLVDDKVFNLILSSQDDEALIEACLRCMRSIMSWPKVSRTWLLYENKAQQFNSIANATINDNDSPLKGGNLQKIIAYAQNSNNFIIQECVADIFGATCARGKDQALLYKASAIPCIVQLLESSSCRVVIASLNWLTQMCYKNQLVSMKIVRTRCLSEIPVLDRLSMMMGKDRCYELQFLSARCYANIYRATDILRDDCRIVNQVLPTFVRMVHKDKPPHLRVKAAECIAYLIESETRLQNIASVCDHLIDSLANMLEYDYNFNSTDLKNNTPNQMKHPNVQERSVTWLSITPQHQQPQQINDLWSTQNETSNSVAGFDSCSELNRDMKRAAFLALASLASNLEPIRKKIFGFGSVMQQLVKNLSDNDIKTLKVVLTCLLSLSRSVQQLRTSFAENSVYTALKNLLHSEKVIQTKEILVLVLSILCNISLDFSPGKQHFLDYETIDSFCCLARSSDRALRLHGMWILMNMVYQFKDESAKFKIINTVGLQHILNYLKIEDDDEIVLKTLGFLRNLLSGQKTIIDGIMGIYGDIIMPALQQLIERECSDRIAEQCLCVLTNIADGKASKKYIINNKFIMAYLTTTMCDLQGDLRLAAICCITNLAHKEYEGSDERRDEMKKWGIDEKLKSMLNTNDPVLSDRVRTAYNQFLVGIDDKYVN